MHVCQTNRSSYLSWSGADRASSDKDRILLLSDIRNQAMLPLPRDGSVETVLFVNDIYTEEGDVLELLHQHFLQQADQTCGLDYETTGSDDSRYGFRDVVRERPTACDTMMTDVLFHSGWRGASADTFSTIRRLNGQSPHGPEAPMVCKDYLNQKVRSIVIDGRPACLFQSMLAGMV